MDATTVAVAGLAISVFLAGSFVCLYRMIGTLGETTRVGCQMNLQCLSEMQHSN